MTSTKTIAPTETSPKTKRRVKASDLPKKEKTAKAAKVDDQGHTESQDVRAKGKGRRKSFEAKSLNLGSDAKREKNGISAVIVDKRDKTKKLGKRSSPTPELSVGESAAQEEEKEEEEVHLHGFSTDEDSSDEDDGALDDSLGLDVSKLPTVAKDDAIVKRKLEKAKRQQAQDRGVIYLGRIPHGFYEDEMKSYFSQFGDIIRLRLSRSKRTGRSKHYAFIEFDSSSVAQIVAETMDNYLLMGHILRCKVIPKEEVHPELWVGANRKWRLVPRDRITRLQQNKVRTEDERERAENRLLMRQEQKKRKLQETGIEYDFDSIAYKKNLKDVTEAS